MRPVRIEANNFVSFAHFEYEFKDGVTALVGNNLTDDTSGGNGAGKSGLQQAIYYAITGNSFRGSTDKKLIRNGESEATVILDIECPIRKELLHIERILPLKGNSKISLMINGKEVPIATVKDGNNFVMQWIGISAEDLKSYFLICKENYKSFFRSSNTEKMALISRFINYDFLDGAKDLIQEEIDVLVSKRASVQTKRDKAEGGIDTLQKMIQEAHDFDFEEDKRIRIEKIETRIEEIESKIGLAKHDIDKCNLTIKESKAELSSLEKDWEKMEKEKAKLPSTKDIEDTIEEIRSELGETKKGQRSVMDKKDRLLSKQDKLKISLREVLVNLSGAIVCPKCKHKFLTLKNTSLKQEEEKRVKIGEEEKRVIEELDKLEASLLEYEELISSFIQLKTEQEEELDKFKEAVKEINSIAYGISSKMESHKNRIEVAANRKESLSGQITSMKGDIKELKKRIQEIEKEKPYKMDLSVQEGQIENAMMVIAGCDAEISELNQTIFNKNEWINRFKAFKLFISLEQLKNIQSRANEVLKEESSDLRIVIEGYKTKANGELKDEITPYVVRDEMESFWYYSGGERARVEIALIIAIQSMINETNQWGGLQFLSIDEITEGLSKESLYDVIEALGFIKFPVMVTTHIPNENAKCKVLKVIKENGISRIEEE